MKLVTNAQFNSLIENANKTKEASDSGEPNGSSHKPVIKLFTPWGSATWLITEYHKDDDIFFGLTDLGLGAPELGYIRRTELENMKGPFGLCIERDRHFVASMTIEEYANKAHEVGKIIA